MNLRKTRSVLSVIITFILALSITCASVAMLINATVASYGFMADYFISEELAAECEKQLDLQFEALSEKSGIPVRVFETSKSENSVRNVINLSLEYVYGYTGVSVNEDEKTEYFYKLCTEYLDGNNISYNHDDVMNAAREAAEIYIGCCTLQNTDYLSDFVENISSNTPKIALASLFSALVCGFLLFILYSKKHHVFEYFASSISGAGAALILISFAALITRIGNNIAVSPQIYSNALYSSVRMVFLLMLVLGAAELILGAVCSTILYNNEKKKRRHRGE